MINQQTPTVLSAAQHYTINDIAVTPVQFQGKAAFDGWDTNDVTPQDLPRLFRNKCNIGVLLGAKSNGLVDLDLDCPQAIALAPFFLPQTNARFGRDGKRNSHWLYRSTLHETEDRAALTCNDPVTKATLVELRMGGGGKAAQTVVPPSVHVSGNPVEWEDSCSIEGIVEVDAAELKRCTEKLMAAALLVPQWCEGARHGAAKALAGWLVRQAWSEVDAVHFVEAIATAADDDDIKIRTRAVRDTYKNFENGKKVTGLPKLRELLGAEAVNRAAALLAPNRDQRIEIQLRTGRLHEIANAAEDALVVAQAPVYTQAGTLVRSMIEEADAARGRKTLVARIRPCSPEWLARELSQHVSCVRIKPDKDGGFETIPAEIPRDLPKVLLASASTKFSELAGIIETPTLRPDGSILSTAGYDPVTGLLLVNPPPMPEIAERPTRQDAETALQTLQDLLTEFPFADEASRSVALSILITPVVRGAMPFAPLHVATAPIAGSGKSYLFDTAATIATGKACPVISAGASGEETEKRLHGAALSGQPIISVDNLNGTLRGDFLCQLATQELIEVRRLGSTGNVLVRNCATTFANGNNIEIEGDLVRRTVRCSLNPEMENPEAREFKGDPVKAVQADRGKYVAAALTLVRAHLVVQRQPTLKPLAGFGDWSRLVREALVWLSCADPVGTQEGLRAEDPAVAALDLVMEAWAAMIGRNRNKDKAFTSNELMSEVDEEHRGLVNELRNIIGAHRDQALNIVKVGKFLKRHQGRVRRGAKVVSEYDTHSHKHRWRLLGWQELLAPTEGSGGKAAGEDNVVPLGERQRGARAKKATRKDGNGSEGTGSGTPDPKHPSF